VRAPITTLRQYWGDERSRRRFLDGLFDATARDYDFVERLLALGTGSRYRRDALRRAGLRPGMRCLDLGCGGGEVSFELASLAGVSGSVVGIDGFGFGEEEGGRAKIPQVGIVRIEDDVEIGACTTIDRATFGATIIGRGSRIDNLVQIAHNVVIGAGSVLVAQTGVAGSTRLGRAVVMAGQSGAAGHLTIGDRAVVGARAAVLRDLEPGSFVLGYPATDHRAWKKAQVAFARLPDLLHRVLKIEASLDATGLKTAPGPGRSRKTSGSRPRARKRVAGAARRRKGEEPVRGR